MIICMKILLTLLVLTGGTCVAGIATVDSPTAQKILTRVLYSLVTAAWGLLLAGIWLSLPGK